ncbi:hypothetical protein Kisp02_53700 [Kineosporia sp. NBRC 101731]|nr:hypothetical protein Kisp02_53700 [Kineosporia sp. NBRC 101731]
MTAPRCVVRVVCASESCWLAAELPAAVCRVTSDEHGLILMWPCGGCGCGWVRPVGKDQVALLRASAVEWTPGALALAARLLHPAGL